MSDPGSSLEQRYGAPSAARRVVLIVVAAVVTLGFLAWLGWTAWFHADPAVSSEEIGHEIVDDHHAVITVRITYGDGPVRASCRARAIADDKTIVGEVTYVPDEARDHEIEIVTDRRATTVEWLGCTTAGQPRPR